MTQDWQPISLAPVDEVVMTKIDDEDGVRNEQPLIRQGRLWFFPNKSMCVCYTPTHWHRIIDQPPMSGREKSTLAN